MRPSNTNAPSCPLSIQAGREKLKLWLILATVSALSDTLGYSVCSWIPLFYEIRCMFVWCLILLEPTAWCRFYDVVLSPAALKVLHAGHELKSSFVVRRAVHSAITTTSSFFIVLIEVAVSTGALDRATADLENTIIPWHDRISRFDVKKLAQTTSDLLDKSLEDTLSGDEMKTLTQRTIDQHNSDFASAQQL